MQPHHHRRWFSSVANLSRLLASKAHTITPLWREQRFEVFSDGMESVHHEPGERPELELKVQHFSSK